MLASWVSVTSWHLVTLGSARTMASATFCVLPLRVLVPHDATGSVRGVAVGVGVLVSVGVGVCVDVDVGVLVGVGVSVGVAVCVGVGVAVCVAVGVDVLVAVAVGVGVPTLYQKRM